MRRPLFAFLVAALTALLVVAPVAEAGTQILQALTAVGTAVTNTTTETSFARKAFARNELSAGKVFEFEAMARATSTNATDTLTPRVRFGTSSTPASNTSVGAGAAVDVANNDYVVVRGKIHVLSTTSAVFIVTMNDPGADATAAKTYTEIVTIAADTAYNLDITGTWSVANAGNSARAEAFTVVEVF